MFIDDHLSSPEHYRSETLYPERLAESVFPLPPVPVIEPEVVVTTAAEPVAELGKPLFVTVTIRNETVFPCSLQAKMTDSDAFHYAGEKFCQVVVNPQAEHVLTHCVVPVVSGHHVLPKLLLGNVGACGIN